MAKYLAPCFLTASPFRTIDSSSLLLRPLTFQIVLILWFQPFWKQPRFHDNVLQIQPLHLLVQSDLWVRSRKLVHFDNTKHSEDVGDIVFDMDTEDRLLSKISLNSCGMEPGQKLTICHTQSCSKRYWNCSKHYRPTIGCSGTIGKSRYEPQSH